MCRVKGEGSFEKRSNLTHSINGGLGVFDPFVVVPLRGCYEVQVLEVKVGDFLVSLKSMLSRY